MARAEGEITFRILGPLAVHSGGTAVALPGNRQRALLAFLLLHANERVTNEVLLEAVWGSDAGGSMKRLQVAVMRLRKALEPLGPETLRTVTGGYQLAVGAGELDAEVFVCLVREGTAAFEGGDPELGLRLLRAADGLWRGETLADFAFETFAQDAIRRVDEQRLAAIETRIDCELALDRHAKLIPELEGLVATHPTRDRFAARLMLALYRCGRQVDALEVYRSTRTRLASELGLEPAPELQQLEGRILNHDPLLDPPAALPAELEHARRDALVGRSAEYRWLRERWERARAGAGLVVLLSGPRGMGKTRLVAELGVAAHDEHATVRYVSARQGRNERLVSAIGSARSASRPTLLVIEDVDAALADEVAAQHAAWADVPVLTVMTAEDPRLVGYPEVLALAPLEREAIGAIAAGHAPHGIEPPVDWLLDASGGVPALVHELAGQWARREAARHVSISARKTADGRAALHTFESELAEQLAELQSTSDRATRAGDAEGHVICPFKGLAAFDVADAQYFFGRERLVRELVTKLVGTTLLGVVGPSGSGKSSVVRAGLLPALAEGVLPALKDHKHIIMRPGEHPPDDLSALVGDGPFVLAVDQFEEVFTVCRDPDERAAFIAAVMRLVDTSEGRGKVIFALRADQYGRCAEYPALSRLLGGNHVLVPPLSRDEVRRAIECPCERAWLEIDPELTERLIDDVARQAGALPLLSTALLELWQRRDGRHLRLATYADTGGISGAVARLAEDAFGQLSPDQQTLARSLLLRLTAEGDAGAVERRRVALAELEIEDRPGAADVLQRLTDQRLLTVTAGTVELSHEALLREWPRLRAWIDEDLDGLRIQRALTIAADEWERVDRDDELLYRGTRLTEALEWRTRRDEPLNHHERDFLDASEARRRGERSARRRKRGLALGAVSLGLIAAFGVALTWYFATRERDIAASRDLATKSGSVSAADPALGEAIALEALKRHDTEQAESAVRQAAFVNRGTATVHAHDGVVFDVALDGDGRMLTAGEDGRVRLWKAAGLEPVATIERYENYADDVAFSPDGTRAASVNRDGQVVLTPLAGGEHTVLLRLGDGDFARTVEFTPDGKRLLVATANGVVGLVATDVRAPALQELTRHGDRARAHLDPKGTRAVSVGDDATARIVPLTGGAPLDLRDPGPVVDAAFSPDGASVATVGGDGFIRVWNASTGAPEQAIRVGPYLGSVRYSPTGRRLVLSAEDGVVRVVDLRSGGVVAEMRGHSGGIYGAVFAGGENEVISAGSDGTLRTWAVPQTSALSFGGEGAPDAVSFSPDGRHAVAGFEDGTVRTLDLVTGAVAKLPGHSEWTTTSYSPDGRFIASASYDKTVRLWDIARGRSIRVPALDTSQVAVAAGPGGRQIAVAGIGEDTILQAPDGTRRLKLHGHTGDIAMAAFSTDGRHLVTASDDKTVRVWDTADGSLESVLRGHDKRVISAAFSRDGDRIVSGDTDGTVRVWSVDGDSLAVLYGHEGPVNSAEFNPRGDRVVTTGLDGTVRVFDATSGAPLVVLREQDRATVTARFSADGTRVLSSGVDGLVFSTTCEVCGSFGDALDLARSRLQRELTATERQRLLSGTG